MIETALRRLMPLPRSVVPVEGDALTLGSGLAPRYTAVRTRRLENAVGRLAARDRRGGGGGAEEAARATNGGGAIPVALTIQCAAPGETYPALGDREDYSLTVSADGVGVTAPQEWGVLRALATLAQLTSDTGALPLVRVDDAPRFPWRGLMLDVARHFIGLPDLMRVLGAMEVFKLNVLHLHLSDDQGFRFPSRAYPRLPSSERYRREELQALVAEAAERGIRVVPELDVPGHTASWLAAYPEWGNRTAEPSRRFGVHRECLDPTRPAVAEALKHLFAELAEVFPDQHLHIGGDEVHPDWWSGDGDIRQVMEREGMADAADLQAWFNDRLVSELRGLGRRAVAWDEALHPRLAGPLVVQAWRGATARDRALAAGHDCVVSAPYYLDLLYPADVHYGFDPEAPQEDLVAREDALLADPRFAHIAAGMAWTRQWRDDKVHHVPEHAARVLGAEACLWSELVDARVLDVRLWSRMPALAERFWSPAACRDVDDLHLRLAAVIEALPAWAGVDVHGDYLRLTRQAGLSEAWRPLADMLEPVKWYGRLLGEDALAARLRGREMPKARPYDADTALDRVVDGLPPESPAARSLVRLTRAEVAGDRAAESELRSLARLWAALPAGAGPAELEPAAARLRELGVLVQAVLDGRCPLQEARARLTEAAEPVGEYLLAPAPVLAAWVELRAHAEGDGPDRDGPEGEVPEDDG